MIPLARQISKQRADLGATAHLVDLRGIAAPITVHLVPAATNDLKLEASLTDTANEDPANARWVQVDITSSSAAKRVTMTGTAIAVRISRSGGSGTANAWELHA